MSRESFDVLILCIFLMLFGAVVIGSFIIVWPRL